MFVFASLKCLHIVLESYNTFLKEYFSLNHSYVNIFFYMTNRTLEKFKKEKNMQVENSLWNEILN